MTKTIKRRFVNKITKRQNCLTVWPTAETSEFNKISVVSFFNEHLKKEDKKQEISFFV